MRLTNFLKVLSLPLCIWIAATTTQGQAQKFSGYGVRLSFGSDQFKLLPIIGDGINQLMTVSSLMTNPANSSGREAATLTISAHRMGAQWDVRAYLGLKASGEPPMVASKLRTGDVLSLAKFTEFGLRPCQISIVRIEAVPAVQPETSNRTSSLSFVSIQADVVPGPYHITLMNNSNKPVQGLELRNYKGTRLLSYFPPEGSIDRPLIEPRGTYVATVETAAGYDLVEPDLYRPHQSDLIEISSVVFVDGSFEGQPYNASVVVASQIGGNAELDIVISAIDGILQRTPGTVTPTDFNNLVTSIEIEVGPCLEQLSNRFPALKRDEILKLTSVIQRGMSDVRGYVLRDLRELEQTGSKDGTSFSAWLIKEKAKLQQRRRTRTLAS
jgi:hypothetical protein